MGCFGCEALSFPCVTSKANRRRQCYTLLNRCDGESSCRNNEDEKNCAILLDAKQPPWPEYNKERRTDYRVGYSRGIFNLNFKGTWLPITSTSIDKFIGRIRKVCEMEMGISISPQK